MKIIKSDRDKLTELRLDRLRDALRLVLDNIPKIPDGPRWEPLRNSRQYAQKILMEEKKYDPL